MEKDKINIDEFFKTQLQNFESNADEAMFEEIKKKIDNSKLSVDDYFKAGISGFEANADGLNFDDIKKRVDEITDTKIPVDDYFKGAILDFEGVADDALFNNIKSKVDASKTTIDNYFRNALLDFNSYALPIPFSEVLSKLDREKIIDEHFKNALQNYEGKALDQEFAVIRERVLKLQEKESRKRYAWLLLLLLIPVWFIGSNYFNQNSTKNVSDNKNQSVSEQKLNQNNFNSNKGSDEKVELNKNNSSTIPSGSATGQVKANPGSISNQSLRVKNESNSNAGSGVKAEEKLTEANNSPMTNENKPAEDLVAKEVEESKMPDANENSSPAKSTETKTPNTNQSPGNTEIRKPKPTKYTLELSGATAYNNRYLHSNDTGKYVATRNNADKNTFRTNFGLDLSKEYGRLSFGVGLHSNEFGQHGIYQIHKSFFDSIPLWDTSHTVIKGYFINYLGDTSYIVKYENIYTNIEFPLYASFRICSHTKWDYEVGSALILSYLAKANGSLPTQNADGIIALKDNLKNMNRFGAAITVSQKVHYNLTNHWQLGTELYLKTNITSLAKKSTGITEYPYAFGWRWGLGYKF